MTNAFRFDNYIPFQVVVVAEAFEGMPLIQRHQMVHKALAEELEGLLHALTIQSKTPQQWEKNCNVTPSPKCLGGMAKEAERLEKEE